MIRCSLSSWTSNRWYFFKRIREIPHGNVLHYETFLYIFLKSTPRRHNFLMNSIDRHSLLVLPCVESYLPSILRRRRPSTIAGSTPCWRSSADSLGCCRWLPAGSRWPPSRAARSWPPRCRRRRGAYTAGWGHLSGHPLIKRGGTREDRLLGVLWVLLSIGTRHNPQMTMIVTSVNGISFFFWVYNTNAHKLNTSYG